MAVKAIALALIHRRQQRIRVVGMHGHVEDAGFVVLVKDMVPGFAAIDGFEYAAFLVVAVTATQGADINDVGVLGMNQNLADLEGLPQAHVFPGFAAVGGFVNAVTIGHGIAWIGLAGSDPDYV